MPACQAVVVSCMDFRLRERLASVLALRHGISGFDLICLAGGGKNLAEAGPVRDVVLDNVEVSLRLHRPGQIVVVNHQDCGAYGGSAAFASWEAEREFHRGELELAATFVRNAFPGVEVRQLFVTLEETDSTGAQQ
ncbi:MAG: hypothetical protein M0Z27_05620 [Thermaerobacter sp.]|nr:hypothetical protein [Thermaerobacter sp.]MDA8145522.1 hypothetical protein [Thermaerobacter sp.]